MSRGQLNPLYFEDQLTCNSNTVDKRLSILEPLFLLRQVFVNWQKSLQIIKALCILCKCTVSIAYGVGAGAFNVSFYYNISSAGKLEESTFPLDSSNTNRCFTATLRFYFSYKLLPAGLQW